MGAFPTMPNRQHPSPADILRPLAREFPSIDAAVAEMARCAAEMSLPKGAIHVISDIHGEDKKLRHVINNASGTLRPLVEQMFQKRLPADEFQALLTLIFYPAEVIDGLETTLTDEDARAAYARRMLTPLFEIVRVLAARRSLKRTEEVFPEDYRDLFSEILHAPTTERGGDFVGAIVGMLAARRRALHFVHLTCRVIRNLAVDELVIAGDCWDRGPRGDRVVDYLMQQPDVSFVWGNHDMAWLGACLGHEALICHVLRVSLRYRRLTQLEEGYGIPVQPLEVLARAVYHDDPATCFLGKGKGMRETEMIARMQKAAAIMEFKLEGQMLARHPEWEMESRRMLHRIDHSTGTIEIDGVRYPLKDTHFPTIDPADPYTLSAEEKSCLARIRQSFLASKSLWRHMRWMVSRGRMVLRREQCLIFHGCLPVDEQGEFLPMPIRGRLLRGRELFAEIERTIFGMMDGAREEMDLLWYLWAGPASPLSGKDKIATLEADLIEDKKPKHETKNPYFALIHEPAFCDRILEEFGVDPAEGLIVNGHVPVKMEKGESPQKRSGKAITIDGAFSEVYGDHGYTLVLEAQRTILAEHSHFESVEAAVRRGADIIPKITVLKEWSVPKRVADSERGAELRARVEQLHQLVAAYEAHAILPRDE
jgi:fructose-1,6-bisphosphatase-3